MATLPTYHPFGAGGLTLDLTVRPSRNTLAVTGELDLGSADRLRRVIARLVQTDRPLDLDLSGVCFVDCSGWRVVRDAVHRAGPGATVRVVATSPQVRRLVSLLIDVEHGGPASPTISDVRHG